MELEEEGGRDDQLPWYTAIQVWWNRNEVEVIEI